MVQIFLGHDMKSDACALTIPAKPLLVITHLGDPEELLNPQRVIGTTTAITPSQAQPIKRPINFSSLKAFSSIE